jgi:hypothetical protein
MSARRRSAHPPMTAVAMPLDKLDVWLRAGAAAAKLSMLGGFVTAIVGGPVSLDPPEWVFPLLGIDIDAFNHGGTPEFAPILVHCVDNQGCPLLGPSGNGSEADPAGRTAYKDIPGAVEAIRQYWMPTRFKT